MAGLGPGVVVLLDNQRDRAVVADTLGNAGFRVIEASDEDEAVEFAHAPAIELAVIPTRLCGQSVGKLRQQRPDLKILFVAETPTFRRDGIAPADVVIAGPVEPGRLLSRACALVLEDRPTSPGPAHAQPAELAIAAAKLACLQRRRDTAGEAGALDLALELGREMDALRARHRLLSAEPRVAA